MKSSKGPVAVDVDVKAGVEEFEAAADLVKIEAERTAAIVVVDVSAGDDVVHVEGADAEADISGVFVVRKVIPFSVEVGFVATESLPSEEAECEIIFAGGDAFPEISLKVEVDISAAGAIAGGEVEFARHAAESKAVIILRAARFEALSVQRIDRAQCASP